LIYFACLISKLYKETVHYSPATVWYRLIIFLECSDVLPDCEQNKCSGPLEPYCKKTCNLCPGKRTEKLWTKNMIREKIWNYWNSYDDHLKLFCFMHELFRCSWLPIWWMDTMDQMFKNMWRGWEKKIERNHSSGKKWWKGMW